MSTFKERLLKDALDNYHYSLGNAALALGDLDDAVTLYRRGIDAGHGHPKLHLNLALTLERAGRTAEAIEARRMAGPAGELPRTMSDAWFDLAKVLDIQGRQEQAAEALAKAVEIDPRHLDAQFDYGMTSWTAGHIDRACAAFRAFLSEAAPDYSVRQYRMIGHMLQDVGRHDVADLAFRRARLTEPENYGNPLALAEARLELGDFAGARRFAHLASTLFPPAHGVFSLLGWIAAAEGDAPAAEAWHLRAVDRAGWRDTCHFNLATFLIRQGRHAEAIEGLNRAKRCPSVFPWMGPWIHLAMGVALDGLGRAADARAANAAGAAASTEKGLVFYYLGPETARLRTGARTPS